MSRRAVLNRVEDTAAWVAMARALESERSDALFRDPLARRLAGRSGELMARDFIGRAGGTWPIVARTCLIDAFVRDAVQGGVDAVVNLAAGLDTRPYRLPLPEGLTWIEVDHAQLIADKEAALQGEAARCRVERVSMDLAAVAQRRAFFARVRARFPRTLVITEGLLYYLAKETALALAKDLLALAPRQWITDLHNAAVAAYLAKRTGDALQGTARMQFATDEGPAIFEPLGWKVRATCSVFKEAARLKRLPFPISIFAWLRQPAHGTPRRPWSGVCVLEPAAPAT